MAEHELKVWPAYFDAIESGVKTFEFRRDDREPRFMPGDVLRLREWRPWEPEYDAWSLSYDGYTGRELTRRVTYVARAAEIMPLGYCCMAIVPLTEEVSRG